MPPPRRSAQLKSWLPSRHALWWILGAFVLGLLVFALVLRDSSKEAFYRAGPNAPTAATPDYAPLPAPMAGDRGEGIPDAPVPRETAPGEERPRLVETPRPPPAAPAPAPRTGAPTVSSQPQPISSPAPRYPAGALRRGERGTVLVRVQVGVDGVPTDVSVGHSSGSRELDRAAVSAVRRWRFRPAMSGELPVSSSVQVPINFQP
ncbi:energy transducer TonB [Lysobacter solisilvae]|uniref:Energy transducer TonB n=2 Tax=Agrilutibacter solisilvae TaxID=2763317 RepID=A0A974Y2J2_9GAMM|nr:energy transducer TonB [Lysobacter solisilvae]